MDLFSWLFVFIFFHFWCFDTAHGQNTSYSSCPEEFQCGTLRNLSFPFSKSAEPDCGLCKVDCEAMPNPIIELEGVKYQGLEKHDVFITLKDPILGNLLKKRSCRSFGRNVSLPISPSITYRASPLLTLFKCNTSSQKTHEVFSFPGYQTYNGCESFILYYNSSVNYFPGLFTLPASCSIIQLPMSSKAESGHSGLFDLLSAKLKLGWTVSPECNQCYYRGGLCEADSNDNFVCEFKGSFKNLLWTAWFVMATVAVIGCIGFGFFFCIRKNILLPKKLRFWESKAEDHRKIEAFLRNYGSYAPKRYSYSEVKRITNRFRNKLGQGGYGYVYKGSLPNGNHVAVKVLNKLEGSGEEFINEVASISRTSHVNIVSLVGFCFEGSKRALIYDFMPNGSLEKFIHEESSNRVRQLGWRVLYRIALGIARGLEYLHRGCNTRILHFDIKPHNILLDEDFCPKISDFGLAKLCMKKESVVSMSGARGTVGYIAPEIVCRNLGGVSHKSDVYSYGMMILEMVGGRRNFDAGVDRTSEAYLPHWLYRRIELDEDLSLIGIMNEGEKECAIRMVKVSLWCIQTDPSNRPSMTKVVEILEGNLDSLQIPPKPYLYFSLRSEEDSSIVELTSLSIHTSS